MWFKVDDNLHSHPKVRRAGFAAMGLWVMAGAYSGQYGTAGWVPGWFVRDQRGGKRLAAKLVEAGLWSPAQRDGEDGWEFHDWDEFQPSAEEVAAEKDAKKEANRERQRRWRERRRAEREAEARNADRNALSRVTNSPPTSPDPGASPSGDAPPATPKRDSNGRRNATRNGVTSRVTQSVTPGVTDGGSAAAESAASRVSQPEPPPEPEHQNTPAVLASHGLARHEQRDFLAHLRRTGSTSPNALVSKLHRSHELDGRIDEWRLSVEADAQANTQASAPPPGKRTTTHKVRVGFDLAAKYAAEEAAAAGEDTSPASLRLIEGT